MKRREFLSKLMRYGLSAGALSALPVERLFAQELLPTLAIPIIDAHAHLPSDVSPEGHTFMAIRSAKLSATSIAVMGDKDSVVGADLAFTYALEGIQIVRSWEAAGLVKIVRQPRDIPLKPDPTGPIHVILAIEGGDAIGTQLNRVDELYKLGVRMITLVHGTITQSGDNAIGRDMRRYSSSDPNDGGLTDFGRQVVARMNRLGMVIDVAHASTQTLIDVASCTRAPIIDSHTSPMPPSITTRDAGGHRRLYDEMASIVETGGWENISDIGLLTDAMRAGGLGTLEISAFMGLNLLRVFTRCHAARPILNYFY